MKSALSFFSKRKQELTSSFRCGRRCAALGAVRALQRTSLRRRTRGRRHSSGAGTAIGRSRSTCRGRCGSHNTCRSTAANIIVLACARSEALAVLLGIFGAAVTLGALVPRALVGRQDLRLVGSRDVDAHCLAVHVADFTCCNTGCDRRRRVGCGVGARGGAGGGVALSNG